MGLGLTATTVAAGVQVADPIGDVATKEPDKGTGDDDGDDGEAQSLKLPAGGDEQAGADLAGGSLHGDEDGVDDDDPKDVGEEGGAGSVPDGGRGQAPLVADVEDAKVGLVGARPVDGGVEAGTGLAGPQLVDLLAGQLLDAADPAGLGHKEHQQGEGKDADRRGDPVEEAPALVRHDHGRADAQADHDEALRRADERDGLVALVDEHHVLDDERDQRLDGARPQALDAAGREVAVQPGGGARPEPSREGAHRRQQQHGPPPHRDGHGHHDVRGDAVDQQRDGRQQRHLVDGRPAEPRQQLHRVEVDLARREDRPNVDLPQDLRVDARVLEHKHRHQRPDDELCRQRQRSKEAQRRDRRPLSPLGQVQRVLGIWRRHGNVSDLSVLAEEL